MSLTQARVREVLRLDEAGVLVWLKPPTVRTKPGMTAGSGHGDRRFIGIDGTRYPAAHLKHLYLHGSLPAGFMDARSGAVFDPKSVKSGQKLTAENIRELMHYEPSTGAFTWLARTSKCVQIGDACGSKTSTGYLRTHIFGKEYLLHRLAWFYVHGAWPEQHIDHINGVRDDNRMANLRDVPRRINQQNQRRANVDSVAGVLGVRKRGKSFNAEIGADGKTLHLGTFDSTEAAHAAYVEAKRRLHAGCTL